jgi:hypothetical protein
VLVKRDREITENPPIWTIGRQQSHWLVAGLTPRRADVIAADAVSESTV